MATYKQIQQWIKHNYGFTVKPCWIAHVKELCGIHLRKAPNRANIRIRINSCPENKINIIKEAFKNFGMM